MNSTNSSWNLRAGRIIGWTLVALFVLFVGGFIVSVLTRGFFAGPGYYYPRPYFFPFGFFFFPFGFFFFVLILFFALRWLFWPRRWGYSRGYWRYHDDAAEILRQRYAKGEITKEQFEQMLRDLEKHT